MATPDTDLVGPVADVVSTDPFDMLIQRDLTEIPEEEKNFIKNVGDYAFSNCTSLTFIDLPKATFIGASAFNRCINLEEINLPEVTSIDSNAFMYCHLLTSINLPKVISTGDYNFYTCSKLTSVTLPEATHIGGYNFYGCSKLTSINLPKYTSPLEKAFRSLTPDNPCTVTLGLPSTDSKASSAPWGCTSSNVTFVFTDGKKYTYGTGLHD